MELQAVERSIVLAPELTIAAKCWGSPDAAVKVLATHGWMDNANTWDLLSTSLVSLGCYVVCIDLPGHGKSSHRPPSAYYMAMEYAANMVEVADKLRWEQFIAVGHSMGGGLSSVLASTLPDRVTALVLVENIGLSHRPASEAPDFFAKAIVAKRNMQRHEGSVYSSIEEAVEQRMRTVSAHPGQQYISKEGAERLVRRAVVQVKQPAASTTNAAGVNGSDAGAGSPNAVRAHQNGGAAGADSSSSTSAAASSATAAPSVGYRFSHDRRIIAPSLLFASEDQILEFLRRVKCPTLVITADKGWPFPEEVARARLAALAGSGVLTRVHLKGSHHLHLDPDSAPAVIQHVAAFLKANGVGAAAAL